MLHGSMYLGSHQSLNYRKSRPKLIESANASQFKLSRLLSGTFFCSSEKEDTMGMLDRWFGSKIDYPPLPQDNEAQNKLDEVKTQLEELALRVSDHLEVVPGEHDAFVFLGKPPKRFGIAWIHDGKVSGLKELAADNDLSQIAVGKMIDKLGHAYEHASESERFSTELGGKPAVVIPSKGLEQEVRQIIESAIH